MSRYSDFVANIGATNHWSLDEADGVFNDSIGGLTLNIVGAPPAELGVVNNGRVFSANKYCGISNETTLIFLNSRPFSYSCIFRRDSRGSVDALLARRFNGSSSRSFSCFFFDSSADRLTFDMGQNQVRTISTFLPVLGQYYMLDMVWTNTDNTMRVYVDGVLHSSYALTSMPTSNTTASNFRIGAMGGGETTQNFAGLVDEVTIYNGVALTAAQIAAKYAVAFQIMRVKNDNGSWSDTDRRTL